MRGAEESDVHLADGESSEIDELDVADDEVADAARLRERLAELYDPTVAGSICRWDHSSRDGKR